MLQQINFSNMMNPYAAPFGVPGMPSMLPAAPPGFLGTTPYSGAPGYPGAFAYPGAFSFTGAMTPAMPFANFPITQPFQGRFGVRHHRRPSIMQRLIHMFGGHDDRARFTRPRTACNGPAQVAFFGWRHIRQPGVRPFG